MTPLLSLLHLCDSLFPLGAFAHSDGLEAATSDETIRTGEDLAGWLAVTRDEVLGHVEAPIVALAWIATRAGDADALVALDAESHALRASSAGREAARAMGARLVKTWQHLHPGSGIERVCPGRRVTLPVAFGAVSAVAAIDKESAVSGYMYSRLAATVSAAMRLMPIGQHEAHARLTACLAGVPAVVADVLASPGPLQVFVPGIDLATMRQQYGHSRLFRS